MYSGLLPKDLNEDELSSDEKEDEQEEDAGKSNSGVETQSIPEARNRDNNFPTCGLPGVSQEMWQVCRFRHKRCDKPSNAGSECQQKHRVTFTVLLCHLPSFSD